MSYLPVRSRSTTKALPAAERAELDLSPMLAVDVMQATAIRAQISPTSIVEFPLSLGQNVSFIAKSKKYVAIELIAVFEVKTVDKW